MNDVVGAQNFQYSTSFPRRRLTTRLITVLNVLSKAIVASEQRAWLVIRELEFKCNRVILTFFLNQRRAR